VKKTKPFFLDFHQWMEDSPENRETMFQMLLKHDEPYTIAPGGLQYAAPKRVGLPFFLGVTHLKRRLAFMTGPDAVTSLNFVIGEWTPWHGTKRVDLPIHEIRWVKHI
jgi:hypothetical protein